jgi:hypothetical protein
VGPKALPTLAQCLRGPVLRDLAQTGQSAYLRAALIETGFAGAVGGDTTLRDALLLLFEVLANAYRCDYVYRAAITNKLFLGRYSPSTTTLLSELRVSRSKADMAMFNGTSVAYEIKTELDSVDRLKSQLRDYSGMFDRIFVVTHDRHLAAVRADVPAHVGILVLTRALSFRIERDAISNAEHVRSDTIVDALRREEVIALTRHVLGAVPHASVVGLVDECARALASQSPRDIHDAMVGVLRNRGRLTRDDLVGVAPELIGGYMEMGMSPKKWHILSARLTATTVGALIAGRRTVPPPARPRPATGLRSSAR